jgi:signal transduction histidine kinase
MKTRNLSLLKYLIVGFWLLFTSALAGWWYLFGVEQTRRLIELDTALTPAMSRHLNMLAWEGATLFFCIVLGGGALTYFMIREERQRRRLQAFFSTFTHELKTPLASLRLQAESLKEDLVGSPHATLIDRLNSDTERLTMQLENSLFLANQDSRQMLLEGITFSEYVKSFAARWPGIKIGVSGDGHLYADARALECILSNIAQNAITHGKATELSISVGSHKGGLIDIVFKDNGCGFKGNQAELGTLFTRFYPGSGNGIGLYLVERLARQMGGNAKFRSDKNFEVELTLKGEIFNR